MTQQERDARSGRFQAFASRMQGAFAFAGRSHFERSGRGAVVVNAAELPGGDAFAVDPAGQAKLSMRYTTREMVSARASASKGYENALQLIDRYDPHTEVVVVVVYEDGSYDMGRFRPNAPPSAAG